jgi:hypothetical protein
MPIAADDVRRLEQRIADLKEQIASHEAGAILKWTSHGRDIAQYEVESLKAQLRGAEIALGEIRGKE